ncbi:MAG: LytTR family DNA-binding domain-containing protein [Pseudomonadota bacterium]
MSIAPAEPNYLKWLTVPQGSDLRVIAVEEVSHLRADHKYTTVFTPEGSLLMSASLRQMIYKLDPQMFWQIHRSVVVNVGAIDRIGQVVEIDAAVGKTD